MRCLPAPLPPCPDQLHPDAPPRVQGEMGEVGEGQVADLLLLSRNPLQGPVCCLAQPEGCLLLVMKEGLVAWAAPEGLEGATQINQLLFQ